MPISKYLADANLNWMRGTASFPAALSTNVFISLHSGDPGYDGLLADITTTLLPARATLPLADIGAPADIPGGGGRQCSNTALITLSESALAGGTITYFGLWDAVSAGNFLTYGLVSPPVTVALGDIIRFQIGALVIQGV